MRLEHFLKIIKRKWSNNSGETIIETLFSLLMVLLALTMLAGAILSSAKVNSHVQNQDTAFRLDHAINVPGVVVSIIHKDGSTDRIPVTGKKTSEDKGYGLYDKEENVEANP